MGVGAAGARERGRARLAALGRRRRRARRRRRLAVLRVPRLGLPDRRLKVCGLRFRAVEARLSATLYFVNACLVSRRRAVYGRSHWTHAERGYIVNRNKVIKGCQTTQQKMQKRKIQIISIRRDIARDTETQTPH